jgi:hypothetical protein
MFVIVQHVSDIEINSDIELVYYSTYFRHWSYFRNWTCIFFNIFWTLKLNPVSNMPIFQQSWELEGSKNVGKNQHMNTTSWIVAAIEHSVKYPPILISIIQITPWYIYMVMGLWRYHVTLEVVNAAFVRLRQSLQMSPQSLFVGLFFRICSGLKVNVSKILLVESFVWIPRVKTFQNIGFLLARTRHVYAWP